MRSSDIPEKGIDLTVTVQNWPQGYSPEYLVYNKLKSFKAAIADSSARQVTIKARIIRTSSVIAETSASVELSDRLAFSNTDGEQGFIEINNWQRVND